MNTLMTTELRKLLPPLYSQENNGIHLISIGDKYAQA